MPSKPWHRQTEVQRLEAEIERLNIRIQYLQDHQALTPEDRDIAQLQADNKRYQQFLSETAVDLIFRHYKRHGARLSKT